jgi:hypothetical protein
VSPLRRFHPSVSGWGGDHLDSHLLKEGLYRPEVPSHIIFSQKVYGIRALGLVIPSTYQLEEGTTGRFISLALISLRALGHDRHDGYPKLLGEALQTAGRSSPMIPTMQVE